MEPLSKIKQIKKSRIGIYTVGLKSYWPQFPDMKPKLGNYHKIVTNKLEKYAPDRKEIRIYFWVS